MFISMKRLLEFVFLAILFFLIAIFLYELVFVIDELINPTRNYNEPIGNSIKVSDLNGEYQISRQNEFIQRLKIFYLIGE